MKKLILTSFLFIGFVAGSLAQNQLSKVSFYDNFNNINEVQAVINAKGLEGTAGLFLTNDNNPIDQKAAIINALLTSDKANNAETFTMFLGRKYGINFKELDVNTLKETDLFCLAYITFIEGGDALSMMEIAMEKMPDNATVQLIGSVVKANAQVKNGNHCEAWKVYSSAQEGNVDNNIKSAYSEAMSEYKASCN
jgi:hypothetical protein